MKNEPCAERGKAATQLDKASRYGLLLSVFPTTQHETLNGHLVAIVLLSCVKSLAGNLLRRLTLWQSLARSSLFGLDLTR